MSLRLKILISLIIGLLHIYPDILFISSAGKDFNGIPLMATTDEVFYMGRFNLLERGIDALAGHGLYEHKNDTWSIHPPYREFFLFLPARLLGLKNWQFDLVLTFFMPIFIFWLIYKLTLELSSSKIASLLCAGTILFAYNLITVNISGLRNILSYNISPHLLFIRAVSPQLSHFLLLLCFLLFYQGINTGNLWKAIVGGIIAGFLIYANFFYWAFFVLGLCVFFMLPSRQAPMHKFKFVLLPILIAAIISIPFWVHFIQITNIPSYQDIKFRLSIGNQNGFILPVFQILLFCCILLFLVRDFKSPRNLFLFSFPLAGFILLNQHIVTNINIPIIYIQNYLLKTFLIISAFIVTAWILGKAIIRYRWIVKPIKRLSLSCFIFLLLLGGIIQWDYFQKFTPEFLYYQRWGNVFKWLNENTDKEEVILVDPLDKSLIPSFILAYTHNCVYLPRNMATFITNEEVLERNLLALKFFMYSERDIKTNIKTLCGMYGMAILKEYGGNIDYDKETRKFVDMYKKLNIEDVSHYRVNYVITSKAQLKEKILKDYSFVKLVYDLDDIQIFKVNL